MLLLNQQTQLFLKGPWPPKITSAILLALIGWWAFSNVLPMLTEKEAAAEPVHIVNIAPTPKKSSLKNVNLFGEAKIDAAANKTLEAKPTKLNLTLTGVLATDDPKQGIAQIQNASKLEKHFTVDDLVFGKATLEEIYRDHVVLLHNGRRETLTLPERSLNTKHFSVENRTLKRKETATNYRNIFLAGDGDELTKLFGFKPDYRGGGLFGFIVVALGPKGIEMMNILGVQDGDIIVVVNGLRISESLEATYQLKGLKHATSVDVIIDRNGEEIPFHFEFDTPIADKIDIGDTANRLPSDVNGSAGDDTGNNTGGGNSGTIGGNTNLDFDSDTSSPPSRIPYKNKITADGKVDRSGFTQSLIDSRDDDEDLEPDWDETPEGEAYRLKQQERTTGKPTEVEIDH